MMKKHIKKDISTILNTLWEIRTDDKFYFKTYGSKLITELVKNVTIPVVMPRNSECEIVLRGLQIKNLIKAKKLAKALTVIEEECGIKNVKITIEDVFFCDWIDKAKLDNTEMEILLRDLFIEVYGA